MVEPILIDAPGRARTAYTIRNFFHILRNESAADSLTLYVYHPSHTTTTKASCVPDAVSLTLFLILPITCTSEHWFIVHIPFISSASPAS